MRIHDEDKCTVNHFRVPASLEYDTVVHRSSLETLRFISRYKVPWFSTWTQISDFCNGNEGEMKCFSCLLLVILNQKRHEKRCCMYFEQYQWNSAGLPKGVAVCPPSLSSWGVEGGKNAEKIEIWDGHVVLACELLLLLQWSGVRSGTACYEQPWKQVVKLLGEKAANLFGCTTIYLDVPFHQDCKHLWQMLHVAAIGPFYHIWVANSLQRQGSLGSFCLLVLA